MASRDVRAGESRMPPEVVFALMSLCFLGVNDFLYKWGQQWEMRSGPFMFLQNMAYLPNAFGLAYYRDELILNPGLAFGFINGILAFTAFLFVLLALKRGEAVALVPIVRLNFAVTAALTIFFLGESVNLIKGAALVLAALAVTAGGSVAAASVGDKRSVGLAIGAMCMFGVIGLFYKLGLGMGAKPAMMTAMQSVGVFCMAVPYLLLQKNPLPRRGVPLWLPFVCGVLTSSSYVAIAVGFTYGEAVVVAPIAQLSFVLTGVLAIIFLKEKLTLRKGVGVAFAAASVLLFSRG